MYISYDNIIKLTQVLSGPHLEVKRNIEHYYKIWLEGISEHIENVYKKSIYNRDHKNYKLSVKDLINSINYFMMHDVLNIKQVLILQKLIVTIIARYLIKKDIEIKTEILIKLLDLIDWNCEILFKLHNEWQINKFPFDLAEDILDLSKLHNKTLTNIDQNFILNVSHLAYVYNNKSAYRFIVDNHFTLDQETVDSINLFQKTEIFCVIAYFKEKGYTILM